MLRDDVHAIAAETGAPDEQVRLSLTAIALAQAYERGAIGRCNELVGNSEFPDRDTAHAAAVLPVMSSRIWQVTRPPPCSPPCAAATDWQTHDAPGSPELDRWKD